MKKPAQQPDLKDLWQTVWNPTGSCLPAAFLRVNSELLFLTCLLSEYWDKAHSSSASPQVIQNVESSWHCWAGSHEDIQQAVEHHWQGLSEAQHKQIKVLHMVQPQVSEQVGDQLARFQFGTTGL